MKLTILKKIIILVAAALLTSCVSTPKETAKTSQNDQPQKKALKLVELQNTQTVSHEDTLFEKSLKNIKIEIVSSPKFTTANRKFALPYTLKVTENEEPVSEYKISISYPSSKNDNIISYTVIDTITDTNGKLIWTPDVPTFSADDKVTFYPTPVSSSSFAKQKAFELAVTAPYRVRSSYTTAMGVLYAYNINEKGRANGNNFELLQNLRTKYGINIGNSPIGESTYVNKDISELYKATYSIVGGTYKFMISAFFRHESEPVEDENGVTVRMTAEINCVDMKDGNIIYKTSVSESATEKNKWTAEQKCKTVLAEKAAEAIVYGM